MAGNLYRNRVWTPATVSARDLSARSSGALTEERLGSAAALVMVVWTFYSFKPEWTVPGLKVIAPLQTLSQAALLLAWTFSARKNLKNPVTLYFFLFLIVLTLSTALARNNGLGRDELRAMFFFYITYLATITFANTEKKLFTLFNLMLFGSLYLALLAIKGGGLIRGVAMFEDQNDMALNMNILWPIALFLGMGEKSKTRKAVYFAAVGVFITAVVISNSRGGLVGLLAVMFFVWLKLPVSKIKTTALVLAMVFAVTLFAPQSFWDKMSTLQTEGLERGTSASRIFLWKVALEEFADNPVIGVGARNFGVWLPEYVDNKVGFDRSAMSRETTFYGRVCHSIYFTLLSETGATGFLLFMLMVRQLFAAAGSDGHWARLALRIKNSKQGKGAEQDLLYRKTQACRTLSLGLTGGAIGLLTSGAFVTVLYYPQFWLLCALGVLVGNCKNRLRDSAAKILSQEVATCSSARP